MCFWNREPDSNTKYYPHIFQVNHIKCKMSCEKLRIRETANLLTHAKKSVFSSSFFGRGRGMYVRKHKLIVYCIVQLRPAAGWFTRKLKEIVKDDKIMIKLWNFPEARKSDELHRQKKIELIGVTLRRFTQFNC